MAKRGKAFKWTKEQDELVFSGGSVEGRTPQQNCDRRYKLRKFFAKSTARVGRDFAGRLEVLRGFKKLPKSCNKAFLERLRAVADELEG